MHPLLSRVGTRTGSAAAERPQNVRVSDSLSRRAFVLRCSAAALAVPLAALLTDRAAAAAASLRGVTVRPRSDWARALPVPRPLPREAAGDVRFLIVHHSASPNGYAAGDVPAELRGFHAFHTGPRKGWPDVAYNFFVDAFGTVWEGRAGSLAGPVKPDATGGSQGYSQICCFVGDHTTEPPTAAAQRSMTLLLAGLADRYGIEPGGTTSFVSRGSSRWPAGMSVTTSTIAGHRDMSLTSCPGDAAYPLVKTAFPGDVAALLAARATPTVAPTGRPPAASSKAAAPMPTAATQASRASRSSEAVTGADEDPRCGGVDGGARRRRRRRLRSRRRAGAAPAPASSGGRAAALSSSEERGRAQHRCAAAPLGLLSRATGRDGGRRERTGTGAGASGGRAAHSGGLVRADGARPVAPAADAGRAAAVVRRPPIMGGVAAHRAAHGAARCAPTR